ncbi:uncharacterized protein METZ01_LOCUS238888 [marine metagenome]|uniref:Phage major capsid protein n=1 Tax=marine metagenome TaxID=408172 RepID=A0A382HFB8_9ZZZZ
MAALTSDQLANVANASLDFFINRGDVLSQAIQDKPLFAAMDKASKSYPGGKGKVDLAVKGVYETALAGYTATDQVTYSNPDHIKRVNYTWHEHHIGIEVTHTELKHDGISVSDALTGETSNVSGRDKTVLVNLFKDKMEDMMEGYAKGMNDLLYTDGTSTTAMTGIQGIIADNPAATSASVGGLRTDTNTWWRNRFNVAISTSSGGQELIDLIHKEIRQLRRYGGKPSLAVCGSAFLDRLTTELKSKGNFTQTGWTGKQDISMGEVYYQGIQFQYDPTLDDINLTGKDGDKRCYIIDPSKLYIMYMDGEKMKRHSPTRPHDYYSIYRAITTTSVLCASQLNCHGVYEIS